MRLGKGQRKFVWVIGCVALGLVVLCLTCPLWFPWILRPLAAKAGANYANYQRLGYTQFALDDLTFTNRTIHFSATRVKAVTPMVWLWRLATGEGSHTLMELQMVSAASGAKPPLRMVGSLWRAAVPDLLGLGSWERSI